MTMKTIVKILIFALALAAYVSDANGQTETVTHEKKLLSMGQRGTLAVKELVEAGESSGVYVSFALLDTRYQVGDMIVFVMTPDQARELHGILTQVIDPKNKGKTLTWDMTFGNRQGSIRLARMGVTFENESDVGSFGAAKSEVKKMISFLEDQAFKYF